MKAKTKIHDGIVGAIYLTSIVLSVLVSIQWLYLAAAVAVLQILSPFTNFCPVYYILDKLMGGQRPTATKHKPS